MPMPIGVQFRFEAIDKEGISVGVLEGISDDYSSDLETFQIKAAKKGAVRIIADLALPILFEKQK
jgi:hypothetical protein